MVFNYKNNSSANMFPPPSSISPPIQPPLPPIPPLPPTMQPVAFQLAAAKKAHLLDRLQNKFPYCFSILYIVTITLFGLGAIGLQILMINEDTNYWQICNGIWGGIVCIGLAVINLSLSIYF